MAPDTSNMRQRFIQLTSGWIPVSVLLLLAAALVIGQERIALSPELDDQARPAVMRIGADRDLPRADSIELASDDPNFPVDKELTAGNGRLE